jgi:hypothetical protein
MAAFGDIRGDIEVPSTVAEAGAAATAFGLNSIVDPTDAVGDLAISFIISGEGACRRKIPGSVGDVPEASSSTALLVSAGEAVLTGSKLCSGAGSSTTMLSMPLATSLHCGTKGAASTLSLPNPVDTKGAASMLNLKA